MLKKITITLLIIALIIIAIFIGGYVQQQNQIFEKGFLEGKITITPLCPNYRGSDEDPKCQPTEETYKAWPLTIWTSDKKTRVAEIEPNLDGTYKIELLVGNYIVDLEEKQSFGNLPSTITINSGEITKLNINIDTGIR